ncbi:MAG: murein L,D-transpeptidase catalytic domain family protein [Chitinophagaceae bacterium]|nr:murein L,D-transpeptidase catalytic domain family protein [Chitinophagaceae bacterium]
MISKKFNPKYCILIDMSQPSNQNRLFLYDLAKDSIIKTGLVSHGTGSEKRDKNGNLVFSNVDGSLCTSLGRYKIGAAYKGMWGYSYRLYGLDSSNSNAFKRAVVMHSHACVPDSPQTNNYPICFSYGCPMLSPSTLTFLRKYLDKPDKPVLLWIYN